MAFAREMMGGIAALSIAFAPIAAQANTRAADQATSYAAPIDDDDDDEVAVWVYLFGGVALFALFAAAIDGGSDTKRPTVPNNQSNGAN